MTGSPRRSRFFLVPAMCKSSPPSRTRLFFLFFWLTVSCAPAGMFWKTDCYAWRPSKGTSLVGSSVLPEHVDSFSRGLCLALRFFILGTIEPPRKCPVFPEYPCLCVLRLTSSPQFVVALFLQYTVHSLRQLPSYCDDCYSGCHFD